MSQMLGPIHHWLYNQIKTVEDREVKVVKAFTEKYGVEVKELANDIRGEYGELKDDSALEDLIVNSHIHPWLEGAIDTAQTREAVIVKELMDKYNDQNLLQEIYQQHGAYLAKQSGEDITNNDLKTAFEALQNTLVERMPCDRLSQVIQDDSNKIVWRHNSRLHTEFWQKVDVSIELMHQLYADWIKGFMRTINPQIQHERKITNDYYEDIFTL
ncbi:hypothetical protein [Selenihalanaerobacter shriftii]|uniref:Uncharacterized protein n=1 Tax=Selenihalanaerobacter shriftii TaxID=142842 RepID=A0A1T4LYD3_9FIRM|nr:hypothetical protein [Selenihalanaerobacter shriftii]SJZ59672.1 hypothetical protein SAMN02745118_01295 [Selenihalanaerobacter shriftii]